MVRRASRYAVNFFGAFLTAFLIAAVAIGIRLASGPISLGFLTPMIEDGFAANPDGLKVTVADTILTWSGIDHDVALQIVGIEVRDAQDRLIAKLPSAGIDLSAKALLTGNLAPTGIEFIAPEISIRRAASGAVELGFGGAVAGQEAPDDGRSPIAALLATLRRGPSNSESMRHLASLSLVRARLTIDDEVTQRRWVAQDANFRLLRDAGGGVSLTGGLGLASAGEQVSLRVNGAVSADIDDDAAVTLDFRGLVPALFDAGGATLGAASGIVMPLDGRLTLSIASDGKARTLAFDVRGAAGGLDLPDFFPDGLSLDSLHVAGTIDAARRQLALTALEVTRGDFRMDAAGMVTLGDAGIGFDLTVKLPQAPVNDLGALWPVKLSVNGRRWVMQNIRDGHLRNGVMRLKAAPGAIDAEVTPADIFVGDFDIDGASTLYLAGLPPVSAMQARAHMTTDAIDVAIMSGKVDMGADGVVTLDQGTARVTDFTKNDQTGDISFTASGPTRAALALINLPPLGYGTKMGIDPAAVSGTHVTTARFVLPLVADLDLDNLNFTTTSKMTALGIEKIVAGQSLTGGEITINVDQTKAVGSGTAKLAGAPVKLDWSENFVVAPGGVTTRLTATGTLDAKQREGLGIPTGSYLTGPVDASVSLEGRGQAIAGIAVKLKLDQAVIDLPELGWTKAAGVAGDLSVKVIPDGQRYKIDGLVLKAADLDVAGGADILRNGTLMRLTVARGRLGRSDLTFDMSRPAPDQRFRLRLRGAMLDLSAYMAKAAPDRLPESERPDPNAPDSLPDFDLDIAVDRIQLDEQGALTAFKAVGLHEGGRWRSFKGAGAMDAKARFDVSLTPFQGYRDFRIVAGDAGTIVRILGLYDDIRGGSVNLTARIDDTKPNRPVTAELDVRGFKLVKVPTLARILTLGSLSGIAEAMGGEGISFEALRASIRQESDVIRIDKARAYGSSIGMTLAGTYDTWGRSISVGGTIVPSYGLNRFLGAIPLVGDILTGGEGGGLFAFNYSVVGAVENPEVSVNALSALAPGILRDIVSAVDGTNSAADANAPPVIEVPQKRDAAPPK